ncbi:MAG TPA: pyridoxal-dependent decarboxylase, partial [Thermoanaerobaculia bacterium]
LERTIREDRAAGKRPFCVIGTAGTVNTGAVDDLESLSAVCRQEGLWFHVDGAFGALTALSEEVRSRVDGLALADSLAFDFHKWAHVQYDAGCLLVRDGDSQRRAFSMRPAYLQQGRGLAGGGEWPCDLGPELSRGFRALKVWFALKTHGAAEIGGAIARNCRQAEYLAGLVGRTPGLELMNTPTLSVVCFRVRARELDGPARDLLNEDIVADLQESGIAAPSTTRIAGSVVIRVNLTNHRTAFEDLDLLVRAVEDAAARRIERRAPPNAR